MAGGLKPDAFAVGKMEMAGAVPAAVLSAAGTGAKRHQRQKPIGQHAARHLRGKTSVKLVGKRKIINAETMVKGGRPLVEDIELRIPQKRKGRGLLCQCQRAQVASDDLAQPGGV